MPPNIYHSFVEHCFILFRKCNCNLKIFSHLVIVDDKNDVRITKM